MMKLLLTLVFFYVAFAVRDQQWIVVFHSNITEETRISHLNKFSPHITHQYNFGGFKGYAASLTQEELSSEIASGDVAYVEKDQIMRISQQCTTQNNAVWGINRISEREVELNGEYKYQVDGTGVVAFIIDTGVLVTHNEFTGRASFGANFVGDGRNTDCNGHGTHVAGTVGGITYGVAKKVTIVGVKVLGCSGSGTNAGVISGIQWAATNRKGRPGVANMSLGGGFNKATNDAVAAAVKTGLTFAVAAGNENQDACNVSPASEATAITVGSTVVSDQGFEDQEDTRSSFSNYGRCVKILAPGSLIKSAWYTSNTATNTISGTSMASPHVCGAAALYLQENPNATPAEVQTALTSDATSDLINLLCNNAACRLTPNKLVFSSCGDK